mgnify:CR=1 FL=1
MHLSAWPNVPRNKKPYVIVCVFCLVVVWLLFSLRVCTDLHHFAPSGSDVCRC